ncbi:MAG: hypothetical protein IJU03_04275 [Thermoguttaceae bacterium]|jgi:hypothetical protein|nr:hypothetical protein [Thermoguttaceae bacterium]
MQSLVLLSLGATSLGGAITLGSLFHYFGARTERAHASAREVCEELDRRERDLEELSRRVNAELDAKRAELEALTLQARRAANALGGALESTSLALGRARAGERTNRAATDFEFSEFEDASRRASA